MSATLSSAGTEAGDAFRRETRAWLEANCPPEMRQPVRSEADVCWGGKRFKFLSEAQRAWMQRMTIPPRPGYAEPVTIPFPCLSGRGGISFALLQCNGYAHRLGRGAGACGDWHRLHRCRILGPDAAELALDPSGAFSFLGSPACRIACARRLGEALR